MSAEIVLEKVASLPSLSDNVKKILNICDNPNSSFSDLVEAIKTDPLITINILKAANAPEYGFKEDITDIAQAVVMFGMISIKGFVISNFIQSLEETDLSPYNLDANSFIHIVRKQNAFVTNWYHQDTKVLNTLSMLSHLMEIGKIILSNVVIETSSQKLFADHIKETKTLQEMTKIEKEIFDLSHEEVAAILMKKWGFSPKIYNPLQYISTPYQAPKQYRRETLILHVTKLIINAHNFDRKQNLTAAIAIVKRHRLRPESFVTAYKQLYKEVTYA